MIKREIALLTVLLLSFSFAAGQLSISEIDETYNLGDKLYVTINGIVGADEGNLNLNLICSNQTISLLKITSRAFSSNEQSYALPYKILSSEDLEISGIESLVGNCYLQASLGSQIASSPTFEISDQILVESVLDKEGYDPGETLSLNLKLIKANGEPFTGEVALTNYTEDIVLIESEGFLDIALEENLLAGDYVISMSTKDDLGNQGRGVVYFTVNQIPSRISFGVNTLEVMPGENLTLNGEVLDQGGEQLYQSIDFEIKSPSGIVSTETLEPDQLKEIFFPYDSKAGNWRIIATSGGLRDELTINVLASPHLNYSLVDNILTVQNTGNAPFDDYFNLTIGSTEKKVYARLSPGESKSFVLTAPHGDYEIGLNDGKNTFSGSTFLTGNAVSIEDLSNGSILASPMLWLLLIVILGVGGFLLIQNNPKTKKITDKIFGDKRVKSLKTKLNTKTPKKYREGVSKSLNFTTKSPEVQGIDEKNYSPEDKTMKDMTLDKLKTAESSLVLNGEKITGSVLALKVTNFEQLNPHSQENLEKIIQSVKDQHAVIDKRDNYVFFLFVPQVTRTYKNEILAAKAGLRMVESLTAFNKKFKQRIMFNLGINSGEMIVSKSGGKVKYTSLGNTVSFAKKLSDSGNSKLIVNDDIRKKLLRDLKVEKHMELNEKQTFSVISIKDREANQEKLKELLKRM